MVKLFYNLAIRLFGVSFFLYALVNKKAKLRKEGLRAQKASHFNRLVLVHCASAGEFEQAYPVIKKLQHDLKDHTIAVSFFSASGMQWLEKKNIQIPHYYLPLDRPKKIKPFIQQLDPKLVLVVKNEFWFNFFQSVIDLKIPLILFATAFKKDHFALRYNYFIQILNQAQQIFTLDRQSHELAENKLDNLSLAGDPRIDRIIAVARKTKYPKKLDVKEVQNIIIYASVHRDDIHIINKVIHNKKFQHIIVPHEVNQPEINYFQQNIESKIQIYSEIEHWNEDPIIIDSIGILSSLYEKCTYSYIGGGFGDGIHNLLESAVFGNIIFVGPKNQHFPEARILKEKQAIIEINANDDIGQIIESLSNTKIRLMKNEMNQFFNQHSGASERIAHKIKAYLCD